MTTPTLEEPLDDWDCCRKYDTCTNACAPLVAHLKQRLAQYDAVKVPEPVACAVVSGRGDGYFCAFKDRSDADEDLRNEKIAGADDAKIIDIYSPEVLDLLQAETVAKEKAEAERDALRDRLNSMESLYVATIAREPLP